MVCFYPCFHAVRSWMFFYIYIFFFKMDILSVFEQFDMTCAKCICLPECCLPGSLASPKALRQPRPAFSSETICKVLVLIECDISKPWRQRKLQCPLLMRTRNIERTWSKMSTPQNNNFLTLCRLSYCLSESSQWTVFQIIGIRGEDELKLVIHSVVF